MSQKYRDQHLQPLSGVPDTVLAISPQRISPSTEVARGRRKAKPTTLHPSIRDHY